MDTFWLLPDTFWSQLGRTNVNNLAGLHFTPYPKEPHHINAALPEHLLVKVSCLSRTDVPL